jgi:ABC-type branched-subunit amino acid transport system substrate-binding protein
MQRRVSYLIRVLVCLSLFARVVVAHAEEAAKVGVVLPLSGPLAEMGASFRRGVELYLSDNPKAPISFLFEDHKYDGKAAVTGLHALRINNDLKFVVMWGNTPCSATAPVAEQQKLPMLAISMNPDAKGRKFVVSFGPPLERLVERIAGQIQSAGVRTPGAVAIDIGNSLKGIEMVNRSLNGGLFTRTVANEELDFKPIISQFKARSIDGVVLLLLPQQALVFLKQAKQFDYFPHIVGGDVFAVESFRTEAKQLSDKVNFVYGATLPAFRERLSKAPAGDSYFFEVATGYSVAAISAALAERWRSGVPSEDPFSVLGSLDLKSLPVAPLEYKEDESFGRHFEAGASIYPVAN